MVHLNLSIGWSGAFLIITLLLILLLLLYLRGTFRGKIEYRMKDIPDLEDPLFTLTIAGLSTSLETDAELTGFWSEPDAIYAARLAAVRSAQRTIYFETFYMTPGRRAQEFAAALTEQALAGVKVQLIADHFGVITLPKEYWRRLAAAGIDVHFFHRFDWKAPLNYLGRSHRKLLIIDGKVALTGGAGVSDHWDGMKKTGDTAPWLDCEVRFEGAIVTTLEAIFMQHWLYTGGNASLGLEISETDPANAATVLVTPSDSSYRVSPIDTLFYMSVLAAKERIWIASPYFLLEPNLRSALLTMKKKGIDVRVLTVGPRNDKKLVYYAVRDLFGDLLAAGIEIYEYQPSMMHAKVLLIDNHWVSMGSANFDPRSFFQNDELNVSMAEPKLTKKVEHFFLSAFPKSHCVDTLEWKNRSLWSRILGQFALFLSWQL